MKKTVKKEKKKIAQNNKKIKEDKLTNKNEKNLDKNNKASLIKNEDANNGNNKNKDKNNNKEKEKEKSISITKKEPDITSNSDKTSKKTNDNNKSKTNKSKKNVTIKNIPQKSKNNNNLKNKQEEKNEKSAKNNSIKNHPLKSKLQSEKKLNFVGSLDMEDKSAISNLTKSLNKSPSQISKVEFEQKSNKNNNIKIFDNNSPSKSKNVSRDKLLVVEKGGNKNKFIKSHTKNTLSQNSNPKSKIRSYNKNKKFIIDDKTNNNNHLKAMNKNPLQKSEKESKNKSGKSIKNNGLSIKESFNKLKEEEKIDDNIMNIRSSTTLNKFKNIASKLNQLGSEKSNALDNDLQLAKNKETISTNFNTITTEKDYNENNFARYVELEEENEEDEDDQIVKPVLTSIPQFMRRNTKTITNTKELEKAIYRRRVEYNEYLKYLNKPRPKPKPKPKVYNLDMVLKIQKNFRSYLAKDVIQVVNRKKISLCSIEVFCLLLCIVLRHARRRIIYFTLKTLYHTPFTEICDEVNFTDKVTMKLSDKYYNFNDLLNKIHKKI